MAMWVNTCPLGNMPHSLLSTARSRVSVCSKPFTSTSASPLRTIITARSAASRSESVSTKCICVPVYCATQGCCFTCSQAPTNQASANSCLTARITASAVLASAPHTTAKRKVRCSCLRCSVKSLNDKMGCIVFLFYSPLA